MKGRVDKSMEIVTLIAESLAKIKPTEPLRLGKQAARLRLTRFFLNFFFDTFVPNFINAYFNSIISTVGYTAQTIHAKM